MSLSLNRSVIVIALAAGVPLSAYARENRSIDGTGNNLANPSWGSSGSALLRFSAPTYGDGFSSMGGVGRPNPRTISNVIVQQTASTLNARGMSDWIWQWGQFMDHDLDLVPRTEPVEPEPIAVPGGDPVFAFPSIPFNRSAFVAGTGGGPGNPREQMNNITSYVDGSMVYGSNAARAAALRSFSGGRLAVTAHGTGDLLPEDGMGNFVAGDDRVNEQLGLTAVHTLMVREHNRWADIIAAANPGWSDEDVYQRARKIVGAEIQSITFNEWLPALTGAPVPAYVGYDPSVNATASNEFATALFRVGHTLLSPVLQRLNNDGSVIPEGNIALRDAFFSPNRIRDEGGIEPLLKGLASQAAQEVDQHIVEDVRSFLFTIPTGGFDLAALNIQRGRDHGLGSYNDVRVAFGLTAATSFGDITSDPVLAAQLASVYGDVGMVDPWVGALSEDHLPGSSLGELLTAGIMDQFMRSRAGDRFFYLNDPELADLVPLIESTSLADIIRWNSGITDIQDNVFFVIPAPSAMALAGCAGLLAVRRRRG